MKKRPNGVIHCKEVETTLAQLTHSQVSRLKAHAERAERLLTGVVVKVKKRKSRAEYQAVDRYRC